MSFDYSCAVVLDCSSFSEVYLIINCALSICTRASGGRGKRYNERCCGRKLWVLSEWVVFPACDYKDMHVLVRGTSLLFTLWVSLWASVVRAVKPEFTGQYPNCSRKDQCLLEVIKSLKNLKSKLVQQEYGLHSFRLQMPQLTLMLVLAVSAVIVDPNFAWDLKLLMAPNERFSGGYSERM